MSALRIGTRGSMLARWQAEFVRRQLAEHHPGLKVEVIEIKTQGDIITDVALASLPGKAFFTKEIEDALLKEAVDLAVHSGKDVPTELPAGLELAGFLERHRPLDAWIASAGHSLESLPPGARVGTSSLRRRALVRKLRPDVSILDLRGNVDTRLRKLDRGDFDAIILAAAGLERLGLGHRITALLDPSAFPPAVSQGAMALELRADDGETWTLVAPLIDEATTLSVTAERALLRALEGGCQVPLGALAAIDDRGIRLQGSLLAPDGTERIDGASRGGTHEAEVVGKRLAEELLAAGGDRILRQIRKTP